MNKKVIQKIIIQETPVKIRVDLFLVKKLGKTRNQIQQKIKSGLISINGNEITAKYSLKKGDIIEIKTEKSKSTTPKVKILYDDDDLLVADKPAGISTHPAPGEKSITISEIFRPNLNFPKDEINPGIVHRLDKGTSGVIILAKNLNAKKNLQSGFKSHKVKKTYWALVNGRFEPKEGIIDLPLKRNLAERQKIGVSLHGKNSKTRYRVLECYDHFSFLELKPETGRTHQLRVHLSAIGYPIVGDERYGKKSDPMDKIFLHAAKIEFSHPTTKKKIAIESPLPIELKNVLESLARELK